MNTSTGGGMDGNRRIDEMVAERVMGWTLQEELGILYKDGRESWGNSPEYTAQKCENYQRHGLGCKLIKRPNLSGWSPSTDISSAWEVVEKMGLDGFSFDLEWKGKGRGFEFTAEGSFRKNLMTHGHAVGTAPMTICLAALRTVDVTEREISDALAPEQRSGK